MRPQLCSCTQDKGKVAHSRCWFHSPFSSVSLLSSRHLGILTLLSELLCLLLRTEQEALPLTPDAQGLPKVQWLWGEIALCAQGYAGNLKGYIYIFDVNSNSCTGMARRAYSNHMAHLAGGDGECGSLQATKYYCVRRICSVFSLQANIPFSLPHPYCMGSIRMYTFRSPILLFPEGL